MFCRPRLLANPSSRSPPPPSCPSDCMWAACNLSVPRRPPITSLGKRFHCAYFTLGEIKATGVVRNEFISLWLYNVIQKYSLPGSRGGNTETSLDSDGQIRRVNVVVW